MIAFFRLHYECSGFPWYVPALTAFFGVIAGIFIGRGENL